MSGVYLRLQKQSGFRNVVLRLNLGRHLCAADLKEAGELVELSGLGGVVRCFPLRHPDQGLIPTRLILCGFPSQRRI